MDFFELFSIPFIIRALIGSVLLSIIFGLFGTFIVPRRISFMADGISHASLLGIAFGLFIGTYPLIYAFLVAAIFGFILAKVSESSRITEDGFIGILLTGGMSGALILLSFVPGYKPELFSYLFGNILSIEWMDLYILAAFFVITLVILYSQWRPLVMSTMHVELAQVLRMPIKRTRYFLFVGTAIALIAGVKLLGAILVSALLITPVLTANQIGTTFKSTLILTLIIGTLGSIVGIILSYVFDIPTGPAIALLLVAMFTVSLVYSNLFKNIKVSRDFKACNIAKNFDP